MKAKSKKVTETEAFVDLYIFKHGHPPTYDNIQDEFKIGRATAYARCKRFRYKMSQLKKTTIDYDLLPHACSAMFLQYDENGYCISAVSSHNLNRKR